MGIVLVLSRLNRASNCAAVTTLSRMQGRKSKQQWWKDPMTAFFLTNTIHTVREYPSKYSGFVSSERATHRMRMTQFLTRQTNHEWRNMFDSTLSLIRLMCKRRETIRWYEMVLANMISTNRSASRCLQKQHHCVLEDGFNDSTYIYKIRPKCIRTTSWWWRYLLLAIRDAPREWGYITTISGFEWL